MPRARAVIVAITAASSRLSPSSTYCIIVAAGGTAEFEWKARSTGTVNPDEGSANDSEDRGDEKGCGDPAGRYEGTSVVKLDTVASCF